MYFSSILPTKPCIFSDKSKCIFKRKIFSRQSLVFLWQSSKQPSMHFPHCRRRLLPFENPQHFLVFPHSEFFVTLCYPLKIPLLAFPGFPSQWVLCPSACHQLQLTRQMFKQTTLRLFAHEEKLTKMKRKYKHLVSKRGFLGALKCLTHLFRHCIGIQNGLVRTKKVKSCNDDR